MPLPQVLRSRLTQTFKYVTALLFIAIAA